MATRSIEREIALSDEQKIPIPGKVLIVDDERNIRLGLRSILLKDGHEVVDVGSVEAALECLATFACETAVVDIRMPGMSGVTLLHEIRQRWPFVSVIMLTGHGTMETAITAVQEGAFNYLLKPAKPETIRQTVNEALIAARRNRQETQLLDTLRMGLQQLETVPASPPYAASDPLASKAPAVLTFGELQIDQRAHTVKVAEAPVALTPTEYKVLLHLAQRAGEVIDYVTLVRLALKYDAELWEAKELIKRHIFAMRKKLEADPSNPRILINVRGVGYRLNRA
ncbi:MAG: response regulator transcription factor [Anaerolineaceae bacterium]|nr:MAG: response regulator transcription factor [Anaerolineaceae bacterium]